MAMVHKRKRRQGRAQLKVRLPEDLRREIEHAAARANHSMNTEIVRRLTLFSQSSDPTKHAARALVQGLDDRIVSHMVEEIRQPELIRRLAAALTDEARPDVYYDDLTEEILSDLSGLPEFFADLSDKIRRLAKPAKSHIEATPAEVKK
jgi:hypothetical protein